jgi:hypothetical protein
MEISPVPKDQNKEIVINKSEPDKNRWQRRHDRNPKAPTDSDINQVVNKVVKSRIRKKMAENSRKKNRGKD